MCGAGSSPPWVGTLHAACWCMRRGVALILLCCVPPGASYLISFCDFIYTWVFIVFLWWLRSRIRFVEHHNRKHVRASDYTVYVRAGLPKVC